MTKETPCCPFCPSPSLFGPILIRGTGSLGREATGALNMFVVYLALPAVMFQAMAHIRPADLTNDGLIASFC